MDQLFFPEDGSAQYAALAVEPFGSGVNDEVRAKVDRGLADGSGEAVIYIKKDIVFATEGAGGGQDDDVVEAEIVEDEKPGDREGGAA